MADGANDVVRVAAGTAAEVNLLKQRLADVGIDAQVVGADLDAGLGTAIPSSVELWVKREDAEKARAALAGQ